MRKNRRTDEKLSLRLGTLVPTQGFTQSLTRSLTSGVTSIAGFDPLSLNPAFWFDMDVSMLAAGDVAAEEADLVASLENRVSGGPNATQTTASKQSRAHVPIGDGHLYLPAVSSNFASVNAPVIPATADFDISIDFIINQFASGTGYSHLLSQYQGSVSGRLHFGFYDHQKLLYFFCGGDGTNPSIDIRTSVDAITEGQEHTARVTRVGNTVALYLDGSLQQTATSGVAILQTSTTQIGWGNGRGLNGAILSVSEGSNTNIDFSDGDHKASSFTCSTGQTVTINTSGTDPATIVRKSFMRMDIVDDEYEFTTDSSAVNGTIVVATLEGTYSANISLNASTQYDLQARGVASSPNRGFLKNVIGYLITPSQLSDSEITNIEAYFVDKGAAARSAFGSVTNFTNAWRDCSPLTSFSLINTSSGTSFAETWYNCLSLTSFPLIDTSSGESFFRAWRSCSSLTSFPAINTSSGTNFNQAWYGCTSLTSFPLINTSSGARFEYAWFGCNSLTTFPSGFFDSWSPASVNSAVFNLTWDGCTSLTAQSVENILTSLDTSGVYGTNTGASGGTQLADNTIDIDYDGTTLSSATSTAITGLKSKNWAISINSVIQ